MTDAKDTGANSGSRADASSPQAVSTEGLLVAVLQPDARLRDNAKVPGVRVGNHIAPPSGPHIRKELERILKMPGSSFHQHIAYETLHPFTDGNGRSGRALWLHRRGSAPLGFLHSFYYQTLDRVRAEFGK